MKPIYKKNDNLHKNIESHGPVTHPYPLSDRELPRPRNYSKGQMDEVIKFKKSLPENRERSYAKITHTALFRGENTLSRERLMAYQGEGEKNANRNKKSAIFSENVKAEQNRQKKYQKIR